MGRLIVDFLKKLLIVYSHKLSNVLEQEVRKCNASLTCWLRGTGSFRARSWHYLVWSPLSINTLKHFRDSLHYLPRSIVVQGGLQWASCSCWKAALSSFSSELQFYTSSQCKNTLTAGCMQALLPLSWICNLFACLSLQITLRELKLL